LEAVGGSLAIQKSLNNNKKGFAKTDKA